MVIPRHIAVIMDGNGRWAKRRNLPRTAGHKQGVKRIKEIVRQAKKIGVKVLTIFAFSTENWDRPKPEINFLFAYFNIFFTNYLKELIREDIRLKVIGRRDRINKDIVRIINQAETQTKNNKSFTLVIALDYGGRWDIIQAAKKIAGECCKGKISQTDINEKMMGKYLSLRSIDDPDLLIRTSGEQRISNFLIWELAYSEFYFTPVAWPDFDKRELEKAVDTYSKRERRFGEIHE